MIRLHPKFLTKNGQREFAVLPYEEFVALQMFLDDATDLLDLREAKTEATAAQAIPLDKVKERLGLD